MIDLSKVKVAEAFKHLEVESLAGGLSAGFASLRYKGKMWNLNIGGKGYPIKGADGYNSPYVDFVILRVNPDVSKIYFGEWNEDNATGPICASVKGDVPDPGVAIPQSKTCGLCEHNQWITKPNGGRGQECQSHKRVAILLMPDMTKKILPAPLLEPVYFKIPPGSFKTWKKFDDELQHAGIPCQSFITRVSFVEDQQFEMKFEYLQALTNKEAPLVIPMKDAPQTMSIVGGMTGAPRQIAAPANKAPERIETGLMEAFGAPQDAEEPAPPKRTRAKKVQTIDNAPPVETTLADQSTDRLQAGDDDAPWEESDTDLDETVKRLMNKTSNMLK